MNFLLECFHLVGLYLQLYGHPVHYVARVYFRLGACETVLEEVMNEIS